MKKCECINWCRSDITAPYGLRTRSGIPLVTSHHPNCERFNDSLMDVWQATDGYSKYWNINEKELREDCAYCDGITITKIRMHREIYENLPEFDGF